MHVDRNILNTIQFSPFQNKKKQAIDGSFLYQLLLMVMQLSCWHQQNLASAGNTVDQFF